MNTKKLTNNENKPTNTGIIDLTYPFHSGMLKYPSDPDASMEIEKARTVQSERDSLTGYGIRQKYQSGFVNIKARNHHGTHIDAPAHKLADGKTIDQYGIEKFVNTALVVDLTKRDIVAKEYREIKKDYIKELLDFENLKQLGVSALLFCTGFGEMISSTDRGHLSHVDSNDKRRLEQKFPYFTPEAAEYVAANAPFLNVVGIDSFTVDPSGSNSEAHRAFFARDILLLETVVNMETLNSGLMMRNDNLSQSVFTLHCVPLLYAGADAAQTRAYAQLSESTK